MSDGPTKSVEVACENCGVVQVTRAGYVDGKYRDGTWFPLGSCGACGEGLGESPIRDQDGESA